MTSFAAVNGLEAAKEMLRRYLTERSLEGTMELVTDDVVWFGTSAFERAVGKDQLRRLIADEMAKDPTPMDAIYRGVHTSAVVGCCCTVALMLDAVKRDESGSSLFIRVVFGCVKTNGGWKVASANTTVPTGLQREGEYFPITFAEEKQKQLRNGIIETTIAALESQDIYAWEYDIVHGVFIYNSRVRKKFGIMEGCDRPDDVISHGIILPGSADEFRRVFSEIDSGAREAAADLRCRDAMGAESLYRHKCIAIFDDDGRPLRAVCCLKDLTDILARERERNEMLASALRSADEANMAKTEFFSRMSHEVRTPMNAIIGMTRIALDSPGQADKINDCLKKIELSSKFMLSLVNNIFDISSAAGGKNLLREEPCSIAALVDTLNAGICPKAEAKGLSYRSSVPRDLPSPLLCDQAKLLRALENLLVNAVKFTAQGGAVSLDVRESKRTDDRVWLEFSVSDNGRGISEEFLPHLWEPFAQEEANSYSEYEGVGLGLPITKNIIDMLGGTISVSSIKGIGTKFNVALSFAVTKNNDGELNGGRGLRVLVAEEDRAVRLCAASMLEAIGAESVCTDSCVKEPDADALQGKPYDAVLVSAGVLGPRPAVRLARLRREFPRTAFLLLITEEPSSELAAAANAVLRKPIIKDMLADALARLFKDKTADRPDLPQSFALKGARLLLAEDQPTNAEVACAILTKAGCTVETAANGLVALERFARAPDGWYDAIIMDLRMPVMDGFEATKNIRAMEKTDAKTIPIIALTAQALEDDAEKCAAAGMNGYVAKPIDRRELCAEIEKAVKKNVKR